MNSASLVAGFVIEHPLQHIDDAMLHGVKLLGSRLPVLRRGDQIEQEYMKALMQRRHGNGFCADRS